ncbi:MAG: hypothetical protein AAF447_23235 [Myxococcota bacterium]
MSEARRTSARFGWSALFVAALSGLALEAAHGFKLAPYLDDALTRLLLTLAHAHLAGLALAVLAHGAFASLDPGAGPWLRVAAVLMPAGFALGAIAHPEGDPSWPIVLVPLGALALLVGLGRMARAAWRSGPTD